MVGSGRTVAVADRLAKAVSGRGNESLEGGSGSRQCEEQQPGTAYPNRMKSGRYVLESWFRLLALTELATLPGARTRTSGTPLVLSLEWQWGR